jgi:hypothetical protein
MLSELRHQGTTDFSLGTQSVFRNKHGDTRPENTQFLSFVEAQQSAQQESSFW